MINQIKLTSRIIKNVNGLDFYILENNLKKEKDNIVLLLHGFPEISF